MLSNAHIHKSSFIRNFMGIFSINPIIILASVRDEDAFDSYFIFFAQSPAAKTEFFLMKKKLVRSDE